MNVTRTTHISVIIPSFNGMETLPKLLKSLESQTFKNFEVVVVLDGSTDNSVSLKFNKWDLDLNWVEQENSGRAGARNSGIEKAKYDPLIFIDDDILLEANALFEIVEGYMEKGSNTVHFGELNLCEEHPNPISAINKLVHNFRLISELKWKKSLEMYRGIQEVSLDNYGFTSSLLLIPRSVFDSIGNFNDQLSDSEDFDISMRMFNKGIHIFFNRNACGIHNDYMNIEAFITRQSDYLESKRKLLLLYPEYGEMHSQSFTFNYISKKKIILMSLVFQGFHIETILGIFPFKYLPERAKLRLFDYWLLLKLYA